MIKFGQPAAHPGAGTQGPARVVTAAGLAVDAYVHADLASVYDPVRAGISQGDLFRVEAAASALAALLVLLSARPLVWAFAFLVAASGLGALLLYRYVDVGALGPLPNMYEPLWFTKKTATAVAEALAAVTALAGLVGSFARARAPAGASAGQYSP
ncbi:hypothetical protein KGA66_07605 [Actinocrinis puniceicyclus]|uniref:Uncharacterized protein n=1 Tax=Actinocrinis puniceicyclus TaxID=977794 RepID=A0A8J8BB98_9ACTN|nr:hypothetical protein [Actinocrinis puniceicyclus]MBS2962903.1 hypothetical protein [Actinocrinis puniceicyclus]